MPGPTATTSSAPSTTISPMTASSPSNSPATPLAWMKRPATSSPAARRRQKPRSRSHRATGADELHDMVLATGSTFLGMTVGCARCHDHKFDPITQSDYYSMTALLAGVQHGEQPLAVSKGARAGSADRPGRAGIAIAPAPDRSIRAAGEPRAYSGNQPPDRQPQAQRRSLCPG